MMKSKGLTYALGLVVLTIWGVIIYRIFIAAKQNDDGESISSSDRFTKKPFDDYTIATDTTKLMLNYRDPFGLMKSIDTLKEKAKSKKNNIAVGQNVNWNFIKYSGYIRNPKTKKIIAILKINGKAAMMAEGEILDNVKLLKNKQQYILISYKGITKNISMN